MGYIPYDSFLPSLISSYEVIPEKGAGKACGSISMA
jgi:hypothetical protein